MLLSATFLRHPVMKAEARYQGQIMENTRAGSFWVGLAYLLTYPALLLSVVLYLGALASQIVPGSIVVTFDQNSIRVATLVLIYMIAMSISLYVVVMLVTVGLSTNSISREKQGKTWEALLLTGVDARQLVWGKWLATVRTLWKDYALVWMLRLGMLVWLIVVTDGEFFYRMVTPGLSPELVYLVVGAVMIAIYTLLDAMLTAALGQVAALADRRTGIVVFIALVMRVFVLLAPLILPVLVFTNLEVHEASFYIGFWGVCLVIYAALIWGLLRIGQWLAVRQHALPPGGE